MIARRLKRDGRGVRRAWKTARAYGKSITQPLPAARAEFFRGKLSARFPPSFSRRNCNRIQSRETQKEREEKCRRRFRPRCVRGRIREKGVCKFIILESLSVENLVEIGIEFAMQIFRVELNTDFPRSILFSTKEFTTLCERICYGFHSQSISNLLCKF